MTPPAPSRESAEKAEAIIKALYARGDVRPLNREARADLVEMIGFALDAAAPPAPAAPEVEGIARLLWITGGNATSFETMWQEGEAARRKYTKMATLVSRLVANARAGERALEPAR